MGIQVVSETAEPLTFGKVVLREVVGKIVSGITFGIGYIMAGFTKKKQALHDKIAGTCVVYVQPRKKANLTIVFVFLGIFGLMIIGIIAMIALVSLNSAKHKAREAAFRSEARSMVPTMLIACDEGNITASDLGMPRYIDVSASMASLVQDCGSVDMQNDFSITFIGTEEVGDDISIACTAEGCETDMESTLEDRTP